MLLKSAMCDLVGCDKGCGCDEATLDVRSWEGGEGCGKSEGEVKVGSYFALWRRISL